MLRMMACIVALIPFNAVAQNADTCLTQAQQAARQTVIQVAADQKIEIPSITSDAIISNIATEVCKIVAPAQAGRIAEVASTVSSAYFESAIRIGKATEIVALVEGAVDGKLGLGLPDLHRYGVLTVSCASGGAAIEVRGNVTRCGSRTLLNVGELKVTVRAAAVSLCEAVASIAERQELACDCLAVATTQGVPVRMACK